MEGRILQSTRLAVIVCNQSFLAAMLAAAALPGPLDLATGSPPSAGSAFKPIQPPAWVAGISRMTFCGPDEVAVAATAGAQVIHGNALWPYFPLRAHGGQPRTNEAAALQQFVRSAREHKVRFVLGLPPFPSVEHMQARPDWRVAPRPDAILSEPREDNLGTRMGCNVGPWGDYLIELCAELLQDFGLDGFSFDGNYHPPICYCPYCRKCYQQECGRDLPNAVDLRSLAYREYLVWRGQKLEEHYAGLQRRLKALNPDAVVMTWTANAGRYGHFLTSPRVMTTRLNQLLDLPMQEWWLDESNLGASLLPAFGVAYLRAVSGDRPCAAEPYLMTRGNPYGSDSFPRHERLTRALLAATYGSVAAESLGWPGHAESARAIFSEIKRRETWLRGTRRVPWAALLVSEQTRQFHAWEDIPKRFLPAALGWFRAAAEAQLPLDLINDWDMEPANLSRYRVLVLPDAAALSATQMTAVREFVRAGGGLIASGGTSLVDELGRTRPNFALADLLGATLTDPMKKGGTRPELDANFAATVDDKYWRDRVGVARLTWGDHSMFSSKMLEELVPQKSANFRGPITSVKPTAENQVVCWLHPEAEPNTRRPAILASPAGAGRVAYFAAGLDAGYWSYGYPYEREVLVKALQWAALLPFPVTVEAPKCVQVTFFRQATTEGTRLIAHFFNGANSTAHHGLPEVEVPLREEPLPVRGLTLRFAGAIPRMVRVHPGDLEPQSTVAGTGLTVHLPELDRHFVVVADGLPWLEKAPPR